MHISAWISSYDPCRLLLDLYYDLKHPTHFIPILNIPALPIHPHTVHF